MRKGKERKEREGGDRVKEFSALPPAKA